MPVATWQGISLSCGCVVGISLNSQNLTGCIPDLDLPKLEYLKLKANDIECVPNFSGIPKVEIIELSNNKLTEGPPLYNTPNLRILTLDNNNLLDVPDYLGLLNLDTLHVQYNRLIFDDLVVYNPPKNAYVYAPQDSIATLLTTNGDFLYVEAGIPTDDFEWFKDDLSGGSQGVVEFPVYGEGVYRCQARSNAVFSELTLYSKELEVCNGSLSSPFYFYPSYPYNSPLCKGDPLSFSLPPIFERYVFLQNGEVIYDGGDNGFSILNYEDGDVFSAIHYDTDGCPTFTNNFEIEVKSIPYVDVWLSSDNNLTVSLVNDTFPWSFELISYDQFGDAELETITVNNQSDITLGIDPNYYYEITMVTIIADNCPNTDTIPVGHIDGCQAICVGYSNPQVEYFTANFYDYATNIDWNFYPSTALAKGDIELLGDSTELALALDFSNANPLIDTLILEVVATTSTGIQTLQYTVVLDKECVWPGDVDNDGQVVVIDGVNWINDELGIKEAATEYEVSARPISGLGIHSFQRSPECLATNTYEWYPQSAIDWELEYLNSNGYRIPFLYELYDVDSNLVVQKNLKFADCNGNGSIEDNQLWDDSFSQSFYDVPNPTDHDIIVFHAENDSRHNGNAPLAKSSNNFPEYIHLESNQDTIFNGDQVVFTAYLGNDSVVIENVHHIAFVGEGEFGDYYRPLIDIDNSFLVPDAKVDYPFLKYDSKNNPNDSLYWYVSLGRNANAIPHGVTFTKQEEICQLICHIIIAPFTSGSGGSTNKNANGLIPVTFKIPAAGLLMEDGRVMYVQSQVDTVWVRPNPLLKANVWLEGPFNRDSLLMDDHLRTKNLIPTQSPYFNNPNYTTSNYGFELENRTRIMGITGDAAIVDWIFLELRDKDDPNIVISARSALLTRHGEIKDVDGVSPVYFPLIPNDLYFIKIIHRNHLPMMSATPILLDRTLTLHDFSKQDSYKNGGSGQKEVANNLWAMFAGELELDRSIDGRDRNTFSTQNGLFNIYCTGDLDFSGDVNGVDRILWSNNNGVFSNVP